MIGFGIAGLIVAFIVFAELYSINNMMRHHFCRVEKIQELERHLRGTKYDMSEQNDALKDLIAILEHNQNELTQDEHEILNHANYIASKIGRPRENAINQF